MKKGVLASVVGGALAIFAVSQEFRPLKKVGQMLQFERVETRGLLKPEWERSLTHDLSSNLDDMDRVPMTEATMKQYSVWRKEAAEGAISAARESGVLKYEGLPNGTLDDPDLQYGIEQIVQAAFRSVSPEKVAASGRKLTDSQLAMIQGALQEIKDLEPKRPKAVLGQDAKERMSFSIDVLKGSFEVKKRIKSVDVKASGNVWAIIGAAYLGYGGNGRFLTCLGLEVLPDNVKSAVAKQHPCRQEASLPVRGMTVERLPSAHEVQ